MAVAAVDEGGRTGAFFAIRGPEVEDAVIHFDGERWTRERVEVPAGSEQSFRVVALAAASPGSAWLAATLDPRLARGVTLFKREDTGGGAARWVERGLGAPLFSAAATPSAGIQDVRVLEDNSQALTATEDGVWVDGSLRISAGPRTFTLFFDARDGGGRVTGSWCDAVDPAGNAVCDRPLGSRLSTQVGYRSYAWGGDGFGSRIITNPLELGGGGDTNRISCCSRPTPSSGCPAAVATSARARRSARRTKAGSRDRCTSRAIRRAGA